MHPEDEILKKYLEKQKNASIPFREKMHTKFLSFYYKILDKISEKYYNFKFRKLRRRWTSMVNMPVDRSIYNSWSSTGAYHYAKNNNEQTSDMALKAYTYSLDKKLGTPMSSKELLEVLEKAANNHGK